MSKSQFYLGKTYNIAIPQSKLPQHRVNSLLFNVTNESPFESSQLIGKYKEKSTDRKI